MSKKIKLDAVLAVFVEKYPTAFFPKDSPDIKPLRVGIFTRLTGENRNFHRANIAAFLKYYTSKDRYLRAILTCPDRVDLDGSPFEPVLPIHREYAVKLLSERQQAKIRKEAA